MVFQFQILPKLLHFTNSMLATLNYILNMETDAVQRHASLPTVNGPKLDRFREHRNIKFIELLGHSRGDEGNLHATHGYVFKVVIDSESFALKIVRFRVSTSSGVHVG
jgi:hypothetical protein